MKKFYCMILSTVFLAGCFGQSNKDTMPQTEVAISSTTIVAVEKSPVQVKAKNHKKDAKTIILEASKLNSREIIIFAELEKYAKNFVKRSNNSMTPSKARPKIEKRDGQVIVTYMEIDHTSINLEILPAKSKYFEYIAKMRYVERQLQCTSTDLDSAMSGQFRILASRRVTELPRYIQSKWVE